MKQPHLSLTHASLARSQLFFFLFLSQFAPFILSRIQHGWLGFLHRLGERDGTDVDECKNWFHKQAGPIQGRDYPNFGYPTPNYNTNDMVLTANLDSYHLVQDR